MYSTFYGFTKKPFQLSPDPDFFFNSAVHRRGLAYLRYGLEQGEGFIVVTGAPGTGKTMLVKELFQTIQHDQVEPGLVVTSQVGAEDALRIVSAAYGLGYENCTKAVLIKNLENYFKQKVREGRRILLVIDEAQNLPFQSFEELRMLLNMELEGKPLLQIFMLGQDELRYNLQLDNMEQIRQRITATYHLRALEVTETKEYILHRLIKAGWDSNPSFSDDVFDEIHRYTGGTPRIINNLCDRLLLYGFLEELNHIDLKSLKLVINEIKQDLDFNIKDFEENKNVQYVNDMESRLIGEDIGLNFHLSDKVKNLEIQLNNLKSEFQKEKVLLRKAILIQLDMNDVYDA